MAHRASVYATSVKQWTSPTDTAAAEAAHVAAVAADHARENLTVESQHRRLYMDPPVASNVSPSSITANTPTVITVTGSNFDADCEIVVDGVSLTTTLNSVTELEATAQVVDPGDVAVHVLNAGNGLVSDSLTLTIS